MTLLLENRSIGFDQTADSGAADISDASQIKQEINFILLNEALHHLEELIRCVARIKPPGYLNDAN